MSRTTGRVTLPLPPPAYDQRYMSTLVSSLEQFILNTNNPGDLRATTLTLTNLPTSATGLAPGSVWNDAGTLKVAP